MRNRAVVALFVAFLLSLPALAQQSSSTPSDQSQASSQSNMGAQSAPAGETATGKAPLQYESRQGFWGKINPFARKKYVQRQTQPIRDRLNELDELTAANSKMIKDVDSRSQQGIQMASNKANEADQHAVDAGNKATQAQNTAQQANTRITTVENVVSNIDQYKSTNQTEIRFRPGQTILSAEAKQALDQMVEPVKNQRGYIIEVQGFSSGRGQTAIATSRKMADAVVRYMVENHEIPLYRIYVLGMGNAPMQNTAENGEKPKRMSGGRVEVSLLKNDLEQLATNGTGGAQ
ncbi:MAG TPA: OmpA family protein [Terriglobales bacterium]|nr:OmpA family protein [Terriglobales bacterium]